MNMMAGVITLVACFSTVGTVHADSLKGDPKTYSGIGCTEIPNGVTENNVVKPYGENDIAYTHAGWAYNSSKSHKITVACPIVREHTNKPMKRAWITVFNQTMEDVLCEIEGYDANGLFLEESSLFSFPPSVKPVTVFKSNDKDDADAGMFDSSFEWVPQLSNNHGYYLLICNLPAVVEQVDLDGPGTLGILRAFIIKYIIDEVSN
jgi:hypothetical protein